MSSYMVINGIRIDKIVGNQIHSMVREVTKHNRDKHIVIDGRERSGKSKLGRQLAKCLDATFNIDRIAYTSTEFIHLIRSTDRKCGQAVVLDEAYMSISSRSAMSDVNKAMVGLATEMGQLNLFVIIILPSFFDLDKYFALWRTDTLLHVYFNKKGYRGQYRIYPFEDKLQLYVRGKKTYNYGIWNSPYPPCRFPNDEPINEEEYNQRKLKAFRKKPLTIYDRVWRERTLRLVEWNKKKGLTSKEISTIVGMNEKNLNTTWENWVNECQKTNVNINILHNKIGIWDRGLVEDE